MIFRKLREFFVPYCVAVQFQGQKLGKGHFGPFCKIQKALIGETSWVNIGSILSSDTELLFQSLKIARVAIGTKKVFKISIQP